MTSTDEQSAGEVPGLLEVLARVPDPRKRRGRRYLLVFALAVAVACALAGARNFREVGDHAADLPQDVLRRLGGKPHPLLRRIIAPSETRIRTLVHAIGADILDEIIGGGGWANWQTQANDFAGGTASPRTSSAFRTPYCVFYQAGSRFFLNRTAAFTFSRGVGISGAIGIDLSAQTGYDQGAALSYNVIIVTWLTARQGHADAVFVDYTENGAQYRLRTITSLDVKQQPGQC